MIALLDYGAGNLRSVEKALSAVSSLPVSLTDDPNVILSADKVILPGVGAFGDCMSGLRQRDLESVVHTVAQRGTPLLGICVGMQMLFESSEELGIHDGLGLLAGHVRRFVPEDETLKVPQTGWNKVQATVETPLLAGLDSGSYAYFNHGFYCDPENKDDILAMTNYEIQYASVVGKNNIYGAQFHPEKSQSVGLAILRNFVEKC